MAVPIMFQPRTQGPEAQAAHASLARRGQAGRAPLILDSRAAGTAALGRP